MNKRQKKDLESIFKGYPEIKLVYFFGSKARGKAGRLSDYDFAAYLDKKDKKGSFDIKFALMDKISRLLNSDRVDIVILNVAEGTELKYNIIREGKLIYEKEPYRVIVEPKILNEYFDFRHLLLKYHLTKA
ncbi:MAG: nucleotidyltransferase domain-containing protein [Nitrospinae bacterium]|nr:nucleotidyltransferase domain-containing protein [Nitrospinota bacterium]